MATAASLTAKQERFCRAYVANNGNGHKAALTAGYSPASAQDSAYENLHRPAVAARIKTLTAKALAKFDTDGDRILQELVIIGLANIADYVECEAGKPVRVKPFDEMPFGATRAIKRIKETRTLVETITTENGAKETKVMDSRIEIEFHSKENALELLARKYEVLKPAEVDKTDTVVNFNFVPATK